MTQDAEGRSFVYDAENKQRRVYQNGQLVGEYYYDGDGRRVKKRVYEGGVLTEETVFVYDAFGKLVAEYSTLVEGAERARVNYLTQDHLGSPRINTDRDGRVVARHDYMPFGEEITSAITPQRTVNLRYGEDGIRQKFTSYERDIETNLDFAQARYYPNQHGRFTSVDPIIMEKRRLADPQAINLYVYTRNNPLKYVDHNGEKFKGTDGNEVIIEREKVNGRKIWVIKSANASEDLKKLVELINNSCKQNSKQYFLQVEQARNNDKSC